MHSDEASSFEATVSDLRDRDGHQQRGLFTSRPVRTRWGWRLLFVLVVVGVVAALTVYVVAARPRGAETTPNISPVVAPMAPLSATFAAMAARPFQLPVVRSLATCPVSRGRPINPAWGPAAGAGPLYISPVAADGTVTYLPAGLWGDQLGWGGMPKTLWVADGAFTGSRLVRGQHIDARGNVQFNTYGAALQPAASFMVQAQPPTPYQEVSAWYLRFTAPGCYGLQVDWQGGTEHIIFRASFGQPERGQATRGSPVVPPKAQPERLIGRCVWRAMGDLGLR